MGIRKNIKRIVLVILIICLTIGINSFFHEDGNKASQTIVYITRTGECYHSGSCGYLHSSKIPVTLGDAIARGYRPCSRCSAPSASYVQNGRDQYFLSFIISLTIVAIGYGINIHIKHQQQLKKEKEERERKRQQYHDLYAYKTPKEVANVPKHIVFDSDNLPIDTNNPQRYNVYISNYGKCLHTQSGCSNAYIKTHLFIALGKGKLPCSKCYNNNNREYSIPQWYKDYLNIVKIIKEYDIPISQ